jgi:predicted amidohydrolase YtcJ
VLVDAAMDLVSPPKPTPEDIKRRLRAAEKHLIERGITGAYDMGVPQGEDAVYRELAASSDPDDRLKIRIVGYAEDKWFLSELKSKKPDILEERTIYGLVGVKLYADGALGSRGAYMLAPYSDRPGHRGLPTHSQEEINELCCKVAASGWQAATHAIGDAGNRAVLDAYEKALTVHKVDDHRFRIEHCQIMNLEDIPRFRELGVIASMQPTHATSDMAWVEARIGKSRMAGAYAWRTFLKTGAHLCFGSDFPVEQADITFGLHAAVTREDANGNPAGGWLPEQKLTLEEAIRAFSTEAAYAAKREGHLGMLKKGFQADITCFKENIFEITTTKLRETPVLATIVRGEVVYEG